MLFHGDVWKKNTFILQTTCHYGFKHCTSFQQSSLCLAWWDFFFNSRIGKMFWEKNKLRLNIKKPLMPSQLPTQLLGHFDSFTCFL